MSALHAHTPAHAGLPAPQEPARKPRPYIEVVPSHRQRRARPRLVHAAVIVGGLLAVLVVQLLLSIALADGAYQIAALQNEQRELSREHQILTEEIDVLSSPQNLAARAESLGMVSNESAVYLDLASGAVRGVPTAASAAAGSVIGGDGALLVSNELLTEIPDMGGLLAAQGAASDADADAESGLLPGSGVANPDAVGESVPSVPNGIPAPVTH